MVNNNRSSRWCVWLALLLTWLVGQQGLSAQTVEFPNETDDWERLRILFVPAAELPSVVAKGSPRVLLTREEAVELLTQWRAQEELRRQAKIDDFRLIGPQGFGWERAEYELTLTGESARLRGNATGQVRGQQPVSLTLPWRSGWLEQMTVNEQLPTWYLDDQGQESLLLPPQGKAVVSLDMQLPVTTDSVRQSVILTLPTVAVGRLAARVKGNVELIAGAAVLSRTYSEPDDTTAFELAAGHQSTELVFSLNNRQKQQTLMWDSRAVIRGDLTRVLDYFEILLENRVIQGELSQATWDIPADLEVSQVTGVGVRQWQVVARDGGQRLQVWLHPEQAQQVIRVVAFRARPTTAEFVWEPPTIAAIGATRQPRLVDLASTSEWVMTQVVTTQMDEVPVSVAAEMLRAAPVTPDNAFRRLGTWYGTDSSSRLQVSLRAAADRYAVTASHYVMIGQSGLDARSVFVVENEGDLRFLVRLQIPAGFQISSVVDDQGPLPFRKLPTDNADEATTSDIEVTLRQGIGGSEKRLGADLNPLGPGETTKVAPTTVELVISSRAVPEDWYANRPTRSLTVTPIQVRDAVPDSGIMAVGIAPDFAIQSVESGQMVALGRQELLAANLASLEPNLAFDFNGTNGAFSVELGPKIPDLLVNAVTFYQVESTRQRVHGELLVDVRDGTQEVFQIQLPATAPAAVSFECLQPHSIRQQRRVAEVPGRWEVQLTGPASGRVHFKVTYDVPLALDDQESYELDGLSIVSAPLQTRLISIEGAEGLATQVEGVAEKWSLDRLPETQYQPGRRLLGLWELAAAQPPLTLTVREQTLANTPLAVVQSRSLESRLATDGTVLTFASYEIKSNAGALWLKLPSTAELWSLTHQGVPQTVPAAVDRLRIALPPLKEQPVHRVEFWYADVQGFDPEAESLALSAPAWFMEADAADQAEVPVLQTQWRVTPPPGWVLRQPSSDWNDDIDNRSESWLPRNYRWLAQQSRSIQDQTRGWLALLPKSSSWETASLAPSSRPLSELDDKMAIQEMLSRMAEPASEVAGDFGRTRQSAGGGRFGRRSQPTVAGSATADMGGGMSGRGGMGGMGMGGGLGENAEKSDADPFSGEADLSVEEVDRFGKPGAPGQDDERLQAVDAEIMADQPIVAAQGQLAAPSGGFVQKPSLNLRGYRSLLIPADSAAEAIVLTGLGNKSHVQLALMQGERVDRWSWAIGLFGLAVGLVLTRWSWRVWLLWVAFLLALVAVAQWLHETQPIVALSLERLLWFVAALLIWRAFGAICCGLLARLGFNREPSSGRVGNRPMTKRGITATTSAILLSLVCCGGAGLVHAQTVQRADVTPLDLPEQAILVFYDPAQPAGRLNGQWLVPRDWWTRVRQTTLETPVVTPILRRQLTARGQFVLSLVGKQALELRGTLQLVVPEAGPIYVPLDLGSGRLLAARIGLQDVTIIQQTDATNSAAVVSNAAADSNSLPVDQQVAPKLPAGMWIKLSEPGLQTIELQVHYPLETRPGGWQASGRIPASLATILTLRQLPPSSRVEWSTAVATRGYTVPASGDLTELGVGSDGEFTVRWRAAADQARIGSSSIVHEAVVALREVGVDVRSDFRVTVAEPTDELVLDLPPSARLEAIQSPQLRGWSYTSPEQDRVLLQFLQPANELQFQTRLVGDQAFWSATAVELEVPWPRLPEAGPMTGHLHVLRSSPLRVNVVSTEGLRRAEATTNTGDSGPWLTWNREVFGLQPYQTYQWQTSTAKLQLQVERPQSQTEVTHRSIFQFDAKQVAFESQLTVTPNATDLRRLSVRVPARLAVTSLVCLIGQDGRDVSIPFQVTKRNIESEQVVEWDLRLDQPQSTPVRVVWLGTLPSEIGQPLAWQPLHVASATRETYEYALTKAENLELTAVTWEAADSVLPSEFQAWLDDSRLAQLPLTLRAANREHRWTVVPQRLSAVVSFESVTDLTIADRVVEESLLLEWKIERSGINEVQFVLPALWRDCRVEGPWIGRVARRPLPDDLTEFTVFLQDRILGDYRLVATLDVPRSDRPEATATIPQSLTGQTRQQWITAQNTSQAEVEFFAVQEVTPLQRQQRVFAELQSKIGAEYLANAFVVDTNATKPRLGWRSVTRSTLETRSAQIRLSETDLMLDRQGAYLARQRLQIKNRNQPTLQIQLPADSQLVGVLVDGQSVQPLAMAGQAAGQVTLPLLNSSVLNLDYPVEFLYRGQLPTVETWQTLDVPLAFPINIEAEVSHLRLHLPRELRPLLFDGTMSRVNSSGELLAEVEDYQSKVLAEFKQGVVGGFLSKAQRSRRISELETYLDYNSLRFDPGSNSRLGQEIQELDRALQQEGPAAESVFSNRANLRGLVVEQRNKNEQDAKVGYLNNFINPEMNMPQLGRGVDQSEFQQSQGQADSSQQAAVKRGNANQRLAETLQTDKSIQRQLEAKGGRETEDLATRKEAAALPAAPRPDAGIAMGLIPSLPPATNAPRQAPAASAPEAQRVVGPRLDFVPTGEGYYFRVPRGRPELTATLTTQGNWLKSVSSLELLGVLILVLVLATFLRRRG